MEKGQARLPYGPQAAPLPNDSVLFVGILAVSSPPRPKAPRARSSKRAEAQPLLASDRRVTFLDIEVRE